MIELSKEEMDDVYDDSPEWLQKLVLGDFFQWNKAFETTFQELLDYVTYHDSHWIGSFTNQYLEHILIIRLDAFWNRAYSEYDEEKQEWPFSIIKIKSINSIKYKVYDNSTTVTISSTENEIVEGVAITQFNDIYSGFIELTHQPEIAVLLMSEQGEYLNANPKDTTEKFSG